jgi:hypothetical protein
MGGAAASIICGGWDYTKKWGGGWDCNNHGTDGISIHILVKNVHEGTLYRGIKSNLVLQNKDVEQNHVAIHTAVADYAANMEY